MANSNRQYQGKNGGAGGFYFMGFLGAVIYYIPLEHGFWRLILAFLKACVWPVFFVHDVLRFIS